MRSPPASPGKPLLGPSRCDWVRPTDRAVQRGSGPSRGGHGPPLTPPICRVSGLNGAPGRALRSGTSRPAGKSSLGAARLSRLTRTALLRITRATSEPVGQTSEPVGQTREPVGQTNEPLGQTIEPVGQTSEPVGQTRKPVSQTSEPVGQTSKPEGQQGEPAG